MADARYSIKKNRLEKNLYMEGVEIEGDSICTKVSNRNCIYLAPIDSSFDNSSWGRFHFDVDIEGDMVYQVFIGASDRNLAQKSMKMMEANRLFKIIKAKSFINNNDFLLYSLAGRYLYVAFMFKGEGKVTISNIKADRRGDNFMQIFPQVYQDRNSFFHRYMSVYSSVYNDLEDEIGRLPELLDLDTCDSSLLPVYANWLGIDVGDGFLEDKVLRELVKEAYQLNRMKGTRWCIERVTEIILGEKPMIAERNATPENLNSSQLEAIDKLYGRSIYDVTLLIKKSLTLTQKSQLEYILNQFVPIRCNLRIVELSNNGLLDGYSYMDVNARSYKDQEGILGESSINAAITLL